MGNLNQGEYILYRAPGKDLYMDGPLLDEIQEKKTVKNYLRILHCLNQLVEGVKVAHEEMDSTLGIKTGSNLADFAARSGDVGGFLASMELHNKWAEIPLKNKRSRMERALRELPMALGLLNQLLVQPSEDDNSLPDPEAEFRIAMLRLSAAKHKTSGELFRAYRRFRADMVGALLDYRKIEKALDIYITDSKQGFPEDEKK